MCESAAGQLVIRELGWEDCHAVMLVERAACKYAYTDDNVRRYLRDGGKGFAAVQDDKVVGYTLYSDDDTHIHMVSVAVHPDHQRQRVGSRLVDQVKVVLSAPKANVRGRRRPILSEVREANLPAQLFLRDQGFRAVSILSDHYAGETCEAADIPAYLMRYIPGGV